VRRILVSVFAVAALAACLQAQDAGKGSMTTIQGCLSYAKHHYVLTESNGTTHELSGYANKLKEHVGHEIEVTGTPGVRTEGTTMEGAASTAKHMPDFKVSSIKHIADTCKAAGQ
jgi:hypothetical protein